MTTTIVLADDHHIVRQGLRALLEAEQDFGVVGEAADGLAAIGLATSLRPNILVADLVMPGLGGIEVTRRVTKGLPDTRVIILSMYNNEAYVLEALRAGASGYVLKDSTAADLCRAIRRVTLGYCYLSPPFSDLAIEAYVQKARDTAIDPYESLTGREREVIHLAAEGHSNLDIAACLSISPRTAESHRANLMRKLGLRSQTDLIRFALRRAILPPDNP